MANQSERRRAPRVHVNIPTVAEKVGPRPVSLHPNLAEVYERVEPDAEDIGLRFPATLRDLSANGAFLTGQPLPLLSRVAFTFALPGYGQVDVLGWTLWRRTRDCSVPLATNGGEPEPVQLRAGFGVLFEAISLEARLAIARMVDGTGR